MTRSDLRSAIEATKSDHEQPRVRTRVSTTSTGARVDLHWFYGKEITRLRQGESPSPRAVTILATLAQLLAPTQETSSHDA